MRKILRYDSFFHLLTKPTDMQSADWTSGLLLQVAEDVPLRH